VAVRVGAIYRPMPVETIELLRSIRCPTRFVPGNAVARQVVRPPTAEEATAVFDRRAGR